MGEQRRAHAGAELLGHLQSAETAVTSVDRAAGPDMHSSAADAFPAGIATARERLKELEAHPAATDTIRQLVIRVDALLTQADRALTSRAAEEASEGGLPYSRRSVRQLLGQAFDLLAEEEGQTRQGIEISLLRSTGHMARAGLLAGLGVLLGLVALGSMVQRLRSLHGEAQRQAVADLLTAAVRSTDEGILISDTGMGRREAHIVFANESFRSMAGFTQEDLVGRPLRVLRETCLRDKEFSLLEESCSNSRSAIIETVRWRDDGSKVHCEWHISPVRGEEERVTHYISVLRDVTELREHEAVQAQTHQELLEAYRRLRENQEQLIQSEKMAFLGQLAAGVAHEINNPIGYVMSNLETLEEGIGDLKEVWQELRTLGDEAGTADQAPPPDLPSRLRALAARLESTELLAEVDEILADSNAGLVQVKDIVQRLKNFARPDDAAIEEVDLNDVVESALKIVWNELKHKCTVHKRLGELPLLRCRPGQLNQVFTNLLVNAAQAIDSSGEITIETLAEGSEVVIRVADTGTGIDPEHINDVFAPFFTTKAAGEGTGLGLAVSYGIVQNHSGTIEVESRPAEGTVFTVRLPVSPHDSDDAGH